MRSRLDAYPGAASLAEDQSCMPHVGLTGPQSGAGASRIRLRQPHPSEPGTSDAR
jgi:hypothetical protein